MRRLVMLGFFASLLGMFTPVKVVNAQIHEIKGAKDFNLPDFDEISRKYDHEEP